MRQGTLIWQGRRGRTARDTRAITFTTRLAKYTVIDGRLPFLLHLQHALGVLFLHEMVNLYPTPMGVRFFKRMHLCMRMYILGFVGLSVCSLND